MNSLQPTGKHREWYSSQTAIIAAHIFILSILCIFIFSLHVFVANDYPNHLARMYIYHHLDSSPYLSNFYIRKFELFPYLGMDIFFDIFLNFFDIYTVGKLFICCYMILMVTAILALSKALFNRFETSNLLIYAVIFNQNLAWGFLNYCFTIPFVILTFTAWITLEKKIYYQRIVFFILSQLIFLMHLFAFGILIFITLVYELQKENFKLWSNVKNLGNTALYFAACMVFPIINYIVKKSSFTLTTQWNTWPNIKQKYLAFLSPFHFTYQYLAFSILLLLIIAYLNKSLILEKNKALIIILLVIIPFVPVTLQGIFGIYFRLPIIAAILLLAGSRFNEIKNWKRLFTQWALGMLIIFSIVNDGVFLIKYNKIAINYINSLKLIPPGKKILTLTNKLPTFRFYHLQALSVIERECFDPSLTNAIPPIRINPKVLAISSVAGLVPTVKQFIQSENNPLEYQQLFGEKYFWADWSKNYDFIDIIDNGQTPRPNYNLKNLQLIYQDNLHSIYKILKLGNI